MEQISFLSNFYLLLLVLLLKTANSFRCNSDHRKLQVHLVPHSHDDVGWLKTVDQYYYGSNRTIQSAAVQYILDTVVTALQQNAQRKFIYVEIAFFERWWMQQNEETKSAVKKLVSNKQLEFINGGWSMNDEGAAHYNGMIDQMTLGLRFINETFGLDARPTVAWHIDPFGHSAEQASLFSMMSFDGFFLGRIDYADKTKRLKEQRMEMLWQGSRNFKKATEIFTGVLYNNYAPPTGFCYDEECNDPPIQDDPLMYDMNVKERVDAFVDETCKQAESYKTNHIMLTMGEDFMYQNAHRWFKNLDKLIRYVNMDNRINVFYSTPSQYLKALSDAKEKWEVKTDDFFPYAHCPHCYWTGYFTSRPTQKGYIRESNNIMQACKQVEAMQGRTRYTSEKLRRAMAVNQHHDAVTGTEKQHVANDYAKRLSIGRDECREVFNKFIREKYSVDRQLTSSLKLQSCDYLNISVCRVTETEKSVVINVYNPIARPASSFLRIPVSSKLFSVLGSRGEHLESQLMPVSRNTGKLRYNQNGYAAYELTFEVCAPALGFATYFLNKTETKEKQTSTTQQSAIARKVKMTAADRFIENEKLRLEFSVETGRLVRMIRKDIKLSLNVDQQFFWYKGSVGDKESKQTSGAYIFRPNTTKPIPVCKLNIAKTEIIKGPIVEEVRQTFGSFASQVIRLYRSASYAEFEHTIGPIPINDGVGKEIITAFATDVHNDGIFYTDANGREIKERKRGFRETWKLNSTEPVSENYYPINSRIFINDSMLQFSVLTDRSHGGGSIRDGEVELMLHRRLLKDDFLGVGEALNESGTDGRGVVTRGKHRVILSTPKEAAHEQRLQGEEIMMKPIISFAPNPYTQEDWKKKFNPISSGLSIPLPRNLHLLTFEITENENEVILRFEHLFEKDEDPVFSLPATINLNGLFTDFNVTSLRETNLSANQYLKDKHMMQWNTKYRKTKTGYVVDNKSEPLESNIIAERKVILNPMEIRTFIANIARFS